MRHRPAVSFGSHRESVEHRRKEKRWWTPRPRQLAEEHEYVLLVVGAMAAEADSIERTGAVHVERVAQMVDFTRNFTDGDHHAKEEDLLFPLLEERSASAGGAISVLLSEHEAARDCIRAIDRSLPDVSGADEARAAAARAVIVEKLRLYAFLLPLHIGKEDTVPSLPDR